MRVLYVNHTSLVSGAEHSLLTLLAAMDRERIAGVACPPGPLAQRVRRLGIEVHTIAETSGSFRMHPLHTPLALGALAGAGVQLHAIARRTGASVLHANSVRAGLAAAPARRAGSRPLVVHVRDCLPDGGAAGAVRRVLAARADAVIAISRHVADGLAGRLPDGALAGRVHVIGNPVDLGRFHPADGAPAADATAPALAIVGQIAEWKGHETAIRALPAVRERFPGARLRIVGEVKFTAAAARSDSGAYLVRLRRLIEELRLGEAVELLGEREDVPEIMRAVNAVLVPSREEPFGRTVAEAMATGTPVIATSAGGPAEMVEDGRTGTLAPPGDPAAWSEAIVRVLGDRERTARMAHAALAEARERFDPRAHVKAVQDLYAQVSPALA